MLQSMGSQRVGHDLMTKQQHIAYTHVLWKYQVMASALRMVKLTLGRQDLPKVSW